MNKRPVLLLLMAVSLTASAQLTYRWVDKAGKLHYTDRPPAPGEARQVEEKSPVSLGADQTASYTVRKAMADYPVTLYVQADCPACREGREHLKRRGIPFSEKTIVSQADAAALRPLIGEGNMVVPVMQVGSRTAKGYLGSEWDSLLDAAGYPKSKAEAVR
jgi:glutaredoxin